LTAQRVQDMGLGEIVERQPRARRVHEFDDRVGSAACAGP
jgi:hypothetical protein